MSTALQMNRRDLQFWCDMLLFAESEKVHGNDLFICLVDLCTRDFFA